MSTTKLFSSAVIGLCLFYEGAFAQSVPGYQESITLAIQHADSPSNWMPAAGTMYTISGNAATDAQFGIKYDGGNIVVRTATKSGNFKSNYVGQAGYKSYGPATTSAAWVTTGQSLTTFLNDNSATGANVVKLVERGLGMSDSGTHDAVVEYTVAPNNDNIIRPAKAFDIKTFSTDASKYGTDADFAAKPADMSQATYDNFKTYYANWKRDALDNKTFPWTQLGYTFFWGNGYNLADIQGMSEFIIPGQTPLGIYGIYATESYLYTLNDGANFSAAATAQYGNGFASFKVDGGCDTLWAGHRFQKNVRTATANEITIDNTGSISGGQGLLVWSLNYDVTNNGTISGATAMKYNLANTANIALLFKGDTSTTYGTPITTGINKFTNNGTISSPGTAVKAEAGDTTVINNAGGTISGGDYAVLTGAGNDTLTITGGDIGGKIDLGAGTNTMSVTGASTLAFSLDRSLASAAQVSNVTTATINDNAATLAPSIGGTQNIRDNDSFLIVDAGTLNANAAKITVQNDSTRPMLTFTASKTANQLSLNATRDNTYYRNNSGNTELGTVLDALANSGTGDTSYMISQLDGSGNAADARQLAPNPDNGAAQTLNYTQDRFANTIISHVAGTINVNTNGQGKAAWGQIFNSYLNQYARGSSNGYNADIFGISAGYDRKVGDSSILGVGLGYAKNSILVRDNSGWTDVESYQGNIYYGTAWERSYLSAVAQFAQNEYSSGRNISFGGLARQAKGSYTGQQYGAYAEAGYSFGDTLRFTPLASLQYSLLHTKSYTETGAGAANLTVDSANYKFLQSGLGMRVSLPVQKAKTLLTPDLHAKWLYALKADDMESTAALAGGGASFKTSGYSQPRNAGQVGARMDIEFNKRLTLAVNYDFEFREDFNSHTGYANLRCKF